MLNEVFEDLMKQCGKMQMRDIVSLFRKLVKNMQVSTTHLTSKRKKRIFAVTEKPAKDLTFELDGRRISVPKYFKEKYDIGINPNYPAINVGNKKFESFMPLEVLQFVEGQQYRKLNQDQTTEMLKICCRKPDVRLREIQAGMHKFLPHKNSIMDRFGMVFEDQPAQVTTRILKCPQVIYAPNDPQQIVDPYQGKWNLRDKRLSKGATLNGWAMVSLDRSTRENDLKNFAQDLTGMMRKCGLVVNAREPLFMLSTQQRLRESIMDAVKQAKSRFNGFCQIVVVILPDKSSTIYASIKTVTETELGLPSQCLLSRNIRKANPQFCANVVLKMNLKLYGSNATISKQIPQVESKPTIVFGMDVTHPMAGETKPSIAAVVSSMNIKLTRFNTTIKVLPPRQEIIDELQENIRSHLVKFYQSTNFKPSRVIVYRDGISEGQQAQVFESELAAIRNACKSLEANYCPMITFISVQKRHHLRFIPGRGTQTDKSGNAIAGTVLDTDVVHPTRFEFYLCSHGGLQGTSRPTKYQVLLDENNMTADEIQDMTYKMCYTYGRSTSSVSVVPAVYYAHLAAFRARCHVKFDEMSVTSAGSEGISSYCNVPASMTDSMYFM
jgi:eukaryotic translation initiation factor 2C